MPPTAKPRRQRYLDSNIPKSFYGHHKQFIRLRHDILTSAAFLCLKHSAQLLVIDFIGYFEENAGYEVTQGDADKGIRYSYAMCRFIMSKNTFYAGLRALQQFRFIYPHPDSRPYKGQHQIWKPSTLWRQFRPGQADLVLLQRFNERRGQSIAMPGQEEFDFITGLDLGDGNPSTRDVPDKNAVSKVGDVLSRMLADVRHAPRHENQPET